MKKIHTINVNGQAFQVEDPAAARIDDSCLSRGNAWSAAEIVERLCPKFRKSGKLVTCNPVAGSALEITAPQATKIYQCGRNVLPYPYSYKTVVRYGVTFTDNGDGSITLNGTPTAGWSAMFNLCIDSAALRDGVTYCLPAGYENVLFRIIYKDAAGVSKTTPGPFTWSKAYTLDRIYCIVPEIKTFENFTIYPYMEVGNTPTGYAPYELREFVPGQTIPARAGVNNLWADEGEITVSGRADIAAILESMMKKEASGGV